MSKFTKYWLAGTENCQ